MPSRAGPIPSISTEAVVESFETRTLITAVCLSILCDILASVRRGVEEKEVEGACAVRESKEYAAAPC